MLSNAEEQFSEVLFSQGKVRQS